MMNHLILFILCVMISGCSSSPTRATPRTSSKIPMPNSTPYDGSPAAHADYLDGYRDGFQAAYSGDWIDRNKNQVYSDSGPRSHGWKMGHLAGMAAFMEDDGPEKRIRKRELPKLPDSSPSKPRTTISD